MDCLADIARDGRKGLAPILRERSLADLVAASGELAYGPSIEGRHRMKYQTLLKTLIDQYVTFSHSLNPYESLVLSVILISTEILHLLTLFAELPHLNSFLL